MIVKRGRKIVKNNSKAKKSVVKKSSKKLVKSVKKKSLQKKPIKKKKNSKKVWTRKDTQKLIKDIKSLKIQGATNVAKTAVTILHNEMLIDNSSANINKIIGELTKTRPTEPMMRNAIKFYLHLLKKERMYPEQAYNKVLHYFEYSKKRLADFGAQLIESGKTYFTHCHSSDVIAIFKKARETKLFRVFNTETRPLYQGRITATELAENGIPVVHFVDSGARMAVKESTIVFLGSDAITKDGEAYNKIGSEMIAELASNRNVPIYICTASWKLDPYSFFGFDEKIEQRHEEEIWKTPPSGVIINNYAFEKINLKYIKGIISELGILTPKKFVKETKKLHKWMFE